MSNGSDLAQQIETLLRGISTSAGFDTDVQEVYGFASRRPDKSPLPCLLFNIVSDEIEQAVGVMASRAMVCSVQGVFSRGTPLADLQRLHHDVIRALGMGQLPHIRPLEKGWPFEESAEFEGDQNGSGFASFTSTITLRYVERY